jgi:NADH-quinone oxidoreductase subunit F
MAAPPIADSVRDALDGVLGPAPDWGPSVTRARRDLLLPALHAAHDAEGWLSPAALTEIAARLGLGRAETFGVASFYGSFSLVPRPPRVHRVCVDVVCAARGAVAPDGSDPSVVAAPCLGRCEAAPASMETDGAVALGEGPLPPPVFQTADSLRLLSRAATARATVDFDDYIKRGGTRALAHAARIGAAATRAAINDSGLVGRGGAAFPAGRKWDAVAAASGTKYVVANADESEPGTFKDRVLLEHDPFGLIEAMAIAGWAVGAEHGYVYVRDEYPEARARLLDAVAIAHEAGLLGDDVLHVGGRFTIELRRGAGAYICGEETALFNSIEGHRGEPRSKPPFPVSVGLFGRPTLVHNVETLANVLRILDPDGPGTETKLFSIAGHVARPGVYEVPMGTTLRELLDLAGGVTGSGRIRAVLLGGAAGSFVRPDHLDVALTAEATRAIGATLGSGAVIVLDDETDLEAVVLRIAAFFRDESCGQCVPCRVGTVRQEEALHRLASGTPLGGLDEELGRLHDVGNAMRDASICGLGQTAWNAVESAIVGLGAFGGNGSGSS